MPYWKYKAVNSNTRALSANINQGQREAGQVERLFTTDIISVQQNSAHQGPHDAQSSGFGTAIRLLHTNRNR